MTKSYRIKKNICLLLSLLCTIGPLITFTIMGFVQGEGKEKVCLVFTAFGSIVLAFIAMWSKIHLRSTLYILLIGLWISLDNLMPFIITLAICTMLDELVFTPLYKRFKEDYHTNKQLDKRLNNSGRNE